MKPLQWNMVTSAAGVLRGVHVHRRHWDYVIVSHGKATIGLSDLRPDSATFGKGVALPFDAERPQAVIIPNGVAHGFYFPVDATFLFGVSHYWALDDELGCHWTDPKLNISFPCDNPMLSPRDATLPPLAELMRQLWGDAAR
jgi:dTDP-4-dehydrorhamnose 3,5-epimerase